MDQQLERQRAADDRLPPRSCVGSRGRPVAPERDRRHQARLRLAARWEHERLLMGDAQDHQRRLTRRRDKTAADRALAEDRIAGRPRRDGKRVTSSGRHRRLTASPDAGAPVPVLEPGLDAPAHGHAPGTFLGERYRRLIKRMPKAKALVALQRSILVIFFHLLADPPPPSSPTWDRTSTSAGSTAPAAPHTCCANSTPSATTSSSATGSILWDSRSRPGRVTCRDRQPGMIAAVSLRVLYLIVSRLLSLLTLLSRATVVVKSNETVDLTESGCRTGWLIHACSGRRGGRGLRVNRSGFCA